MARSTLNSARSTGEKVRRGEGGNRRGFFASLVEPFDDAIVGKTLNRTETSWNGAAVDIYGCTGDEIIGISFSILIHKAWPEDMVTSWIGKTSRTTGLGK